MVLLLLLTEGRQVGPPWPLGVAAADAAAAGLAAAEADLLRSVPLLAAPSSSSIKDASVARLLVDLMEAARLLLLSLRLLPALPAPGLALLAAASKLR
jgi:hypothetical protein